jgi:hypothetical protein
MKNKYIFKFLIVVAFLNLLSCSTDKDPVTGKVKRYEPNVTKKVQSADGIFFGKDKNSETTYDFATSNVLWRASLDTLSFMPLSNVSYSGGVITTDWYGSSEINKEQIKINIRFLSDKLETSSVQVTGFKKICDNANICKTIPTDQNINLPIKQKILERARKLSLDNELKKKK